MAEDNDSDDSSNSGDSPDHSPGTRVYDREKGQSNRLVVVHCPDKPCDEWDVSGTGQTVADFNDDYPDDANVCVAVFVSNLEDDVPEWESLDAEELWATVQDEGTKTYAYPAPRLATYAEQDASQVPESVTTYHELICYQYARLIQLAAGADDYGFLRMKYEKLVDGEIEMASITQENKYQLQENFGVCTYCGSEAETRYDHIIPISEGGAADINNQVPACEDCNSAKGDKDVIEWHQDRDEPVPRIVWGKYLKLYRDQLEEAGKLHTELPDDERERWNSVDITRNITRRIRSSHIKRDEAGRTTEQDESGQDTEQESTGQSTLDKWA